MFVATCITVQCYEKRVTGVEQHLEKISMGIAFTQDQQSCDCANVNDPDEENLHCNYALKLLFDADHKLHCHIFTSNKASCRRDDLIFLLPNTHVVNRLTVDRNTLETL